MSLYQTVANMSLYQTIANMSLYQTIANMSLYQTVANMSNYLPLTGGIINDTGYNNTPLKIYFNSNGVAIHIHKIIQQ